MGRGTRTHHSQTRRVALTEYQPLALPKAALTLAQGERLWRDYGAQVRVVFPSPQTGQQWQLTPQGWVGILPLAPDLTLDLLPRVPIANLLAMLEVAWDLASLRMVDAPATAAVVPGFYERLALLLARRTLALARAGLYQSYEAREGAQPALRGRLDAATLSRRPWRADLPCHYHERTVDCSENRIVLWALHVILQSGHCTERTLPTVRAAYRALAHGVTLAPFSAEEIASSTYHRLNAAYQPLHALCRFMVRHTGPALGAGDAATLPFLVSMPRLFEQFVAQWLARHLPDELMLRAQERIPLGAQGLAFVADGVISDRATGAVCSVFDTKYTPTAESATEDIAQVVAYARALGCHDSWLIYPLIPARPLDVTIGETRVRSAAFALGDEITAAGAALLGELLSSEQ